MQVWKENATNIQPDYLLAMHVSIVNHGQNTYSLFFNAVEQASFFD